MNKWSWLDKGPGEWALRKLNGMMSGTACQVLLYHANYPDPPSTISDGLHNVRPALFKKQISWLKQYYDVILLDDLLEHDDWRGKAAITFDDAYNSFFSHAWPVLRELGLPATVFINGCSLEGRPFWRDKIRLILNLGLAGEYCALAAERHPEWGMTPDNLYRNSKQNRINSFQVESLCDEFIATMKIPLTQGYCLSQKEQLIDDPLVSYGSHSFSHYVLSSLSQEEQRMEIVRNHDLLQKITKRISRIFSVPFGGENDFNPTTMDLLAEMGYKGFLFSRNRLNKSSGPAFIQANGVKLAAIERYMPPEEFGPFNRLLLRMLSRRSSRER